MKNKPLPQPQQIQRGEITQEALEAEGWKLISNPDKGGIYRHYKKGGIDIIWKLGEFKIGINRPANGVSNIQDLLTLDRLVNGVTIPSTTTIQCTTLKK